RTSVMQYKNTDKRLHEIGKDLNVSTILEGSIRSEGDSIRIVAQLIDVETDEHLWMWEYNQELTHIFAIQHDVATKIAHALNTRISPEEEKLLASKRTENLHAYDLYLRGRHHWNKRFPPDELTKSIVYFEQAIAADSNFALAYAGLADAYVILGDFNIQPPRETYVRAKEAALKAMSFNSGLSDVHTSLAYVLMHYDWDWSQAEDEFKRAIELNPSSPRAHSWYGLLLTATGRFEEAIQEGKKALELDPFSPAIQSDMGLTLYFSRQYDKTIDIFKGVLRLDPLFALAYLPIGGAYEQKQMLDSALFYFSIATRLTGSHPLPVAAMCHAYALSGMKEDALSWLEILEEKSQREYVAPYCMVVAHLGLGQKERALDLLEQAVTARDGLLVFLKVDPVFNSIRSQPRFIALLEKLGLKGKKSAS
ncbi:MAG: Adenylate cyclase, partial [Bacteroidetes bacterium]|nr:Adenylate cyclase [Bacteroidota bacterium]